MNPEEDWMRCDYCGNEMDEDGNGCLYCPTCRFNDKLSLGEFDEHIVAGEIHVSVGGWIFALPQVDYDDDEDDEDW